MEEMHLKLRSESDKTLSFYHLLIILEAQLTLFGKEETELPLADTSKRWLLTPDLNSLAFSCYTLHMRISEIGGLPLIQHIQVES